VVVCGTTGRVTAVGEKGISRILGVYSCDGVSTGSGVLNTWLIRFRRVARRGMECVQLTMSETSR
jgi:hypothetical protein